MENREGEDDEKRSWGKFWFLDSGAIIALRRKIRWIECEALD